MRVVDQSGSGHRKGKRPQPDREEIARNLTEVRSTLLRIMGNNHHPGRTVTLPVGAVDALRRAEREVGTACQEMLDNWDAMSSDSEAE